MNREEGETNNNIGSVTSAANSAAVREMSFSGGREREKQKRERRKTNN